jgi:hypothetical protein
MNTRWSLLGAVGALIFAADLHAATLPVPTVEYSAERLIETDAGAFTGKIYSAQNKERSESAMQGMETVTILRHDRQVGWMLMPAQKMYQELDFSEAQKQVGSAPQDQVEITEVGSESVEGFASTKYKMLMKDGSAGGFIWITQEGIPVKMDLLSKSGGQKTRVTMTLKNLKIGAQDPQLFELPTGYMAMPGMGFGKGKGLAGIGGALKGALTGGASKLGDR